MTPSDSVVSLPKQQLYLIDITNRTLAKIKEGDNDAKVKLNWIKASKELCSSETFDAYGIKSDFIGYVTNIYAYDDGSIGIKIMLSHLGKLDRQFEVIQENVDESLYETILELNEGGTFSAGDKVKFSGYFKKGKISQNECLDAGMDADPEFEGETFNFKFTKIEKI